MRRPLIPGQSPTEISLIIQGHKAILRSSKKKILFKLIFGKKHIQEIGTIESLDTVNYYLMTVIYSLPIYLLPILKMTTR